MSNTLQQHHFNAIIYYAGEVFAMEMQLQAAVHHCYRTEQELNAQVLSQDVTEVLKDRKAIRPETRLTGEELVEQYNHTLIKAHEYRLNIERDLIESQTQLRTYLNKFADDKVRAQIYSLIKLKKPAIQTISFNSNPFWIDHGAYKLFVKDLANDLNTVYNHNFTYTEPPSNHFIISFLSHPIIRGFNTLALLGGLAALTVGILAATGLITGLPIATVSTLITGGAIASVTTLGLLTASFFRHRSPEELAARCEKISGPVMSDEPQVQVVSEPHDDKEVNDKTPPEEKLTEPTESSSPSLV